MQSAAAIQVELIDFSNITLRDERNPEIVTISPQDGFILNDKFTSDFRIRKSIYEMMKVAQKKLPSGYHFMIYEAYRPLQRQKHLWETVIKMVREKYPEANDQKVRDITETFVADPYNGIGSGHQACCAIDISLCDDNGKEYDMGMQCQEFSALTRTDAEGLSPEAQKNRRILVDALHSAGFINYPAEWWHFSYGDHQWAYLVGKTEALFGPIDI